jgi:hypothetical protein
MEILFGSTQLHSNSIMRKVSRFWHKHGVGECSMAVAGLESMLATRKVHGHSK